jgi:dTDP-4-amino-4,6-dideoxygalactose transaminase
MDPGRLERAIEAEKDRIAAIVPVHVAGKPCDMASIHSIAGKWGIPIVEDAAHAFPVKTRRGYLGTLGSAGAFSFYANKTITTGEGGMVVTDQSEVAKRIRTKRLHGIDRASWDRYTSENSEWEYRVVENGYKYNLTDIAAAIGRVQLTRAEDLLGQRRRIARIYMRELSDCPFIVLPKYQDEHAWHLFLIRLEPSRIDIDRDEFVRRLSHRGIGTSVHYIPLHLMPYYRRRYGFRPEDFPVSLALYRSSFSLPIYPAMSDDQALRVVESIKEIGYSAWVGRPRAPIKTVN